jgi:hypothetical protein
VGLYTFRVVPSFGEVAIRNECQSDDEALSLAWIQLRRLAAGYALRRDSSVPSIEVLNERGEPIGKATPDRL